ncbi:ataxin-7-like protein 2b isoform X1 [Pygocentrus nattereri]|uniref:SCA7 domain-containing protein n=2 Tax=Pygocentrus nattereri TaxID=42514 RepID=A0A3B4BPV1_PYGNA|nr:ataxin-7-like protein 2b isoform X1 [Pygocentrus nattereri]
MAALDRRISILDEFVGQSWNTWVDKADVSTPEGTSGEECSKNVKKRLETMTLRKEDMCIYGHCPAQDEFYLVVCSHCGQVVKPQAFEKHCERRHGPLSKLCGPHSSLSSPPPHWPQLGRPPTQHSGLHESRDGKQQGAGPPRVPPLHPPINKSPKAQKEGTSILQLDKFSHGSPSSPPYLCTPTPRDPPWHPGSTPPKKPPPSEKPLQKGTDMHKPLPGPRTYSRTYKKVPKKECDLDKHCGVLDPERKKLCTRLLTCNIHSIHQRRQVVGRSKSFDQLVLELKMSSKARERAPPVIRDVPEESSPCPQAPTGDPVPQPCRRQIASYVSLRTPSESGVEVEEQGLCSEEREGIPAQCPPPHSMSLSSEESDGENQEESTDLPTSTCHPKPLGLCTFGARVLGCSVLAFDRRLFHLRSALSAMVEHHLSAHLWKKIPQVSELHSHHSPLAFTFASQSHNALRSPPSRVPAPSASSLRTSTSSVPRRPLGDTSTSGQSEPRASNRTPPSKTLTKAPEVSGPGRPRNPVGRPSKQTLQARLGQLQDSPMARKRKKSPPQKEDSAGQNRSFSSPKDRQPSSRPSLSPSHGPINGVFSPGSKPQPQLHVSEMQGLAKQSPTPIPSHMSPPSPPESCSNDGGGASGLHRKALGHDHKGPSRKRKTSGASSPEPPPRHPKPNSLSSSHSPSSLFSWRRDSKTRPVSLSMEKKLDAQKPKLHH